ncbi:unnamed protein product [Brassica oleracea var. botrytis]
MNLISNRNAFSSVGRRDWNYQPNHALSSFCFGSYQQVMNA